MTKTTSEMTTRELLIRVDERQANISKKLNDLKILLDSKADTSDLDPYCKKVDTLWDERNRVLGWIVGAGLLGGGVSQVLSSLVKVVLAKF